MLRTRGPHIQTLIHTFIVQIKLPIPRTGPNGTLTIPRLAHAADVVMTEKARAMRFPLGALGGAHGSHAAHMAAMWPRRPHVPFSLDKVCTPPTRLRCANELTKPHHKLILHDNLCARYGRRSSLALCCVWGTGRHDSHVSNCHLRPRTLPSRQVNQQPIDLCLQSTHQRVHHT